MANSVWKASTSPSTKMNVLKTQLTKWNMHTVQSIKKEKNKLMAILNGIQKVVQKSRNHEGLVKLEKNLQQNLVQILLQEEKICYQRLKQKWLDDGDENTRLYHTKIVQRRWRNIIQCIKDSQGSWIKDAKEIKSMLKKICNLNLYTSEVEVEYCIQKTCSYPPIEENIMYNLNRELYDKEIKQIIFIWLLGGP